jgi:hypothetical protein
MCFSETTPEELVSKKIDEAIKVEEEKIKSNMKLLLLGNFEVKDIP